MAKNVAAMGDEFFTSLPTKLDPAAVPMLVDFVLHQTIPPGGKALLTALNVVGYAGRQLGLDDGAFESMAAPVKAATHDEEIAAVKALEAVTAQEGMAAPRGLPWATLLAITLKLLQALFSKQQ